MQTESYRNSLKYPLILGGVTICSGLSYLAYKTYFCKEIEEVSVPLETAIKILKEFKRELFPVFSELLTMSRKLQNEIRIKRQHVSDMNLQQIKMIITE